ncbi:hypothetical protein [Streptomyces erythrochromogenes]|uniref:hypothetical protein n=1 Tax=Streptomyces erythrochromogenes TaxID=285574 RepID=UPI003824AA2C
MRPPFHFPEDLIMLQQAWQETYTELAHAPADAGTAMLRRRLIALSGTLCTHPYWAASAGWRAGGVELRRAARTPAHRRTRRRQHERAEHHAPPASRHVGAEPDRTLRPVAC